MGTYYNPPSKLPEVARKIDGDTYDELVEQLTDGEKLFGHYERIAFQNAVHLYSQGEYDEFSSPHNSALLLGYYAMPESVFSTIGAW